MSSGHLSEQPRTAIVTGAGAGIGAATAALLAGTGMRVAVLDRDGARAEQVAQRLSAAGGTALAVPADVTDSAAVHAAVDAVAASLGDPTVLVNNAGLARDMPFADMTEHDWDAVLDTNLRGTFLMCRAIRPFLTGRRGGRIVNVSSLAAHGTRNQAAYGAAKAGVQGLTRSLAVELGADQVTVNAVAPGYIRTEMTAHSAAATGTSYERALRSVAAQTPLRRVGEADDVAATIAFLVSDAAGFITGQILPVSGGLVIS